MHLSTTTLGRNARAPITNQNTSDAPLSRAHHKIEKASSSTAPRAPAASKWSLRPPARSPFQATLRSRRDFDAPPTPPRALPTLRTAPRPVASVMPNTRGAPPLPPRPPPLAPFQHLRACQLPRCSSRVERCSSRARKRARPPLASKRWVGRRGGGKWGWRSEIGPGRREKVAPRAVCHVHVMFVDAARAMCTRVQLPLRLDLEPLRYADPHSHLREYLKRGERRR